MFIAIGYSNLNKNRTYKYIDAKKKGYKFASYISSKATILNDYNIGENCFILENNTIQPFVKIENNVVLWSGNHIGHHSVIHNNCFITSHVVVSGRVDVGENCFIGVNAFLRNNIKIASNCVIGAGAWINKDTIENGIYKVKGTQIYGIANENIKL